jgi:hypothetical protein
MSAEAMGLYRILFALYLLIWGVPNFVWIADSPNSFFNPPTYSLGALFSSFPAYWFLQGLSLLIVALTMLLLFGWFTRWVSIGLCIAIVIGKSFAFSYGLIGQDLIVWLVPLLMSFSNWGSKYSIDAKRSTNPPSANSPWPITMMALLLGFGMFSAGVPKLMGGWLDLGTNATRGHFFTQYYVIGNLKLLSSWVVNISNPLFWEAMDWGAVLFELLFLAAVIKPKWFRAWLLLAIGFHTTTFLLFNISFHFQYIVYLLFIDWSKITSGFYQRFQALTNTLITVKGLIAAGLLYIPLYILAQEYTLQPATLAPSPFLLVTDLLGLDYKLVVGITALMAAYTVVVWQLTTKRNSTTT